MTIYRRAIKPAQNQDNADKVEQFITNVHQEESNKQKISSSSEDPMDTSDEYDSQTIPFFADAAPGCSGDPNFSMTPRKTPEEHATDIIKDAEKGKVRMYEVPGKLVQNNVALIDQDYQMIDAHIDNVT